MENKLFTYEDFVALKIRPMWLNFKGQHFAFWMVCCYLVVEFVRPQSIFPAIDVLPWAQVFLVGSIVGAFLDKSVKWKSSFANVLMLGLAFFISMSIFVTPQYPDISRKFTIYFYSWFIIYFLIINIVNTKERFYIFLMIFLLSASKIAIGTSKTWAFRGFSFTSWGLMGPSGYFQNSGELAILMLMLFPLAYYFYISVKPRCGKWESRILALFWICPILTIMGASSRGAQIALAMQLLIIFRKSIFKIKPLIGIVVLALSLFYLLPEEQKARFTSSGEDSTSKQRLLYWEHGWEMMKEFPLTGVGFFNFSPYYTDHFPGEYVLTNQTKAELPHNIFVQVGTDAGFLALGLFISLILFCLKTAKRLATRSDLDPMLSAVAKGLGAGVFGFLIAGQFVTVAYYPFLWVHLALLVSLNSSVSKN